MWIFYISFIITNLVATKSQGPDLNTSHVLEVNGVKHLLGISIDIDGVLIKSRSVGDEIHSSLPLLLLQLKRNASHGSTLDALHKVSNEPRDLVAHALGGDDGHLAGHTLVGVEVQRQTRVVLLDDNASALLNSLGTNSHVVYVVRRSE
jgi:hypothetical protein